MRRFTRMFCAVDATTRTSAKVTALEAYLREAPPEDAAHAVWFLAGGRLKRLVSTRQLRQLTAEASGLPLWLVEESYQAVGDLAETMALLLPNGGEGADLPLHRLVAERIEPLAGADEDARREILLTTWRELDATGRLLFNKLITGGFRVGIGRRLVERALARVAGLDPARMAHRLAGDWQPSAAALRALLDPEGGPVDPGRPYPFFLASPLDREPAALGAVAEWLAEWKWDGIRAQLLVRHGEVLLWSRGEERLTDRFPEVVEAARALPDGTVVDGELLGWGGDRPLSFGALQRRIGRTRLGPRILAEVPVVLMAYDLLERGGGDLRSRPLTERRAALAAILSAADRPELRLSPEVAAPGWTELAAAQATAREHRVEGLMLKRRSSPYRTGRPRGDWWKWKVDPYTVDAVLVSAQRGHGRRASLYTDYTFAVRGGDGLVPVAKAYSGLTDAEIREVDRYVRRHTVERFGPVRTVEPRLVFELHFEGIRRSARHKSGVALRFPRMARWRRDKGPEEADRLEDLLRLIPEGG